jgi:hypothetical protein
MDRRIKSGDDGGVRRAGKNLAFPAQNALIPAPKSCRMILALCSIEGAVMRRSMVEQGAVPPDRFSQNLTWGGDGNSPGDTTIPSQELG